MKTLTLSASVLILSIAAIAATTPLPERSDIRSLSVAELKAIYLECERLASNAVLDLTSAAYCSMVSEELLERSFGGNFEQMLNWWRSTRQTFK
jgi:hypothetical protein